MCFIVGKDGIMVFDNGFFFSKRNGFFYFKGDSKELAFCGNYNFVIFWVRMYWCNVRRGIFYLGFF